jgi:LPS-assembly lipoprotein
MTLHILRRTILLGLLITLAGCGFHMRGQVNLPYKTIYISGLMTVDLKAYLGRTLKTGLNSVIVTRPEEADLLLNVTETPGKQILSYDSSGNITGYRIIEKVTISVNTRDGEELIPPSDIFLTKDMDFSISAPSAAEQLEIFLVTDMRQDISSQILRRLGTLSNKKPIPQ